MPSIRLETGVRASARACFELSLSVDAQAESMQQAGEKAVAGVTSGMMGLGDTVTWRARHFGIPFRMTSRISVFEAPHRFVDEQVSGPFASWRHEHCFEATDDGTRMVDIVDYASPVGAVGRLVDRLLLTGYMTRLLQRRNRWLADELSRQSAGSPGDRLAIHEVIARHGHLIDEGALGDLGTVFIADVVYDLTPVGGGVLTGIDAVADAATAMGDRNPVGHHVTNVMVTALDGNRASAVSKAIAVMTDGTTGSAMYEDELVREREGWRIARRRVRLRRRPLSPSSQ